MQTIKDLWTLCCLLWLLYKQSGTGVWEERKATLQQQWLCEGDWCFWHQFACVVEQSFKWFSYAEERFAQKLIELSIIAVTYLLELFENATGVFLMWCSYWSGDVFGTGANENWQWKKLLITLLPCRVTMLEHLISGVFTNVTLHILAPSRCLYTAKKTWWTEGETAEVPEAVIGANPCPVIVLLCLIWPNC